VANADIEPEELTHAVFECVIHLLARGHYRPEELSQHAMQFYRAYLYYLEVPNGGHSQYIHNISVGIEPDEAREIFATAHAGLMAMGAMAQADILHKMIVWVDANPESAGEQTGFEGGLADDLEPLDQAFYDAEEADPIVKRAAAWIKGWSDLQPVEEGDFTEACYVLADANPKRLPRAAAARIKKFVEAMEPFPVGIALAAAAAKGEILFGIGDFHQTEIQGERKMAWRVRTNCGVRYVSADEHGVSLYEFIKLEGKRTSVAMHTRAGALLGRAEADEINAFMSSTDDWTVAAGADLLLRHARPNSEEAVLSPAGPIQARSWLGRLRGTAADGKLAFHLVVGDEIFVLSQSKYGFVLSAQHGSEIYGPVTIDEAEQHAKNVRE
jgi:hypothetical protein